MGLISQLVLLPAAPLRFTVWVADKVAEEVERQEFSPGAGVRKLEEIQQARERGEISEEEAAELEGRILEQQMSAPTLSKSGQGLDNG
ncbi:MAG TPA: gas vesicle protein GvpG [Candidatus Sulfotelmatobacter sp.]|nr:gas vesicle protein GvpG [Candidatus Sulfotelmatobacter sp.]